MKNLIYTLLACVFVIGCNTEVRYTTSSPEIEISKKALEAYLKADWEQWVTQYSDTAKIFHNDWDNYRDFNQVIDGHKAMLAYFSSYEFEEGRSIYEMIIDDEGKKWVNFWGLWRGTVKETGRKISIPVHITKNFVDGKNVEEYGFWNLSDMIEAIQEAEEAARKEIETIGI